MKAQIKYFHSPDIDDLENYHPKEPDCFSFLLQIDVGPKDSAMRHVFDIVVCTPRWLEQYYDKSELIFLRDRLLVFQYDFEAIKSRLHGYISTLQGESWEDLAHQIDGIGRWEYRDYRG